MSVINRLLAVALLLFSQLCSAQVTVKSGVTMKSGVAVNTTASSGIPGSGAVGGYPPAGGGGGGGGTSGPIDVVPANAASFLNIQNDTFTRCDSNGFNDNGNKCAAGTASALGYSKLDHGNFTHSSTAGGSMHLTAHDSSGLATSTGTNIVFDSGDNFMTQWAGQKITYNSGSYTISSATSTIATVTATVGSHTSPLAWSSQTGFNVLFYDNKSAGPFNRDDGSGTIAMGSITHMVVTWDYWMKPPTNPSSANFTGYEWDPDIYIHAANGNWTMKASIACYASNGKWDVYDSSIQGWRATNTVCPYSTQTTQAKLSFALEITIDWSGSTPHYTFAGLTVNGATVFDTGINAPTCPSLSNAVCNTFAMWAHDSGNKLNFQTQIDMKTAGTTAEGWIDNWHAHVW